jgi:hypothetical protein
MFKISKLGKLAIEGISHQQIKELEDTVDVFNGMVEAVAKKAVEDIVKMTPPRPEVVVSGLGGLANVCVHKAASIYCSALIFNGIESEQDYVQHKSIARTAFLGVCQKYFDALYDTTTELAIEARKASK